MGYIILFCIGANRHNSILMSLLILVAETMRNFGKLANHFQKQPLEVFTENHLCWSISLMKLQAFKPRTSSKRDSNTDVNIKWFLRKPILKNICKWLLLHFQKAFSKNFFGANFYILTRLFSHQLHKENLWWNKNGDLLCERLSNQSRLNRNLSYHFRPSEEKQDVRDAWMKEIYQFYLKQKETLTRQENHSYWKNG